MWSPLQCISSDTTVTMLAMAARAVPSTQNLKSFPASALNLIVIIFAF